MADNWQFGGSFTKIMGRHTIKAGARFPDQQLHVRLSPTPTIGFGAAQTAGLGAQQGVGGNAWASLLLGVPSAAGYRNIHEVANGGWIDGLYIQDQIKATSHLTVNVGFRNDMVLTPIYGTGEGGAGTITPAMPTRSPASTCSTHFRRTVRRLRARPAFRPASTPHRARLLRAGFPRMPIVNPNSITA